MSLKDKWPIGWTSIRPHQTFAEKRCSACSGMARIVGGTNMFVSLVGYSISRTLALRKKKEVTSRYFTQSKGSQISSCVIIGLEILHTLSVVWDLLRNFASARLGLRWTFSAPIDGPWPRGTLHSLRLVNDPVPPNCCCMLLMPLCLSEDSWETEASVQTPPASFHPRFHKIDKCWRTLRLWTVCCSTLRNGHISWGTKPRHTKISLTNCFTETTCRLVDVYTWHLRVFTWALGRDAHLDRVVTT